MNGRFLDAAKLGVATAWAAALLELLAVLALAGGSLASIWEIQYGTLWLLPAAVLVTAPVGALGGLLWALALSRTAYERGAGCALSALLGGLAAYSVSFGRHFDDVARRVGFVTLGAVLAAAVVWRAAAPLKRGYARAPHLFRAGLLLVLVATEIANRFLLVRLYPGFHTSAAVLVLLLSPLLWVERLCPAEPRAAASRREGRSGSFRRHWLVATVVLSGLALLDASSKRLSLFDNFRWVLSEQAPIASHAVQLAALRYAPPSFEGVGGAPKDPADAERVDLQGASVLLVTIDALRADHTGAYGYARPTTPHLDALAEKGLRFEHAYCPTPHTSYSITSMMTGKYIRPLLLQDLGDTSETLATQLRRYGYKTAGFYPPAVFFIDRERFRAFDDSQLGFEYQKREFLEGEARVQQVRDYLALSDPSSPTFAWVHLFGPHEPYEADPAFDFGTRDVDRYDSEVARADATLGALVDAFRSKYPKALVVVTADHGEEFGEHGGRYHGSSVYEEQVRVPLVVNRPGWVPSDVIAAPVQTIDLLPSLLSGLRIPVLPSVRGRDLSAWWGSGKAVDEGFAFAETEEQTLLAQGANRLICQRKIGACKLFDLGADPRQTVDSAAEQAETFRALRARTQHLNASHGKFERPQDGAGRHWPAAVLRGVAGDGDAAPELADLLDDADVAVRRKSAELLFSLGTHASASALRLALQREEDTETRRWLAVALTRLGEGAPLTTELKDDSDREWRRRASLALAEAGEGSGRMQLLEWWQNGGAESFETAQRLLRAFAKIRAKEAVFFLVKALDDVRLRPEIARTLAQIGDDSARGALAKAFRHEPYHGTREQLAAALVTLGASQELVSPLRRWMGVPDPLATALQVALQAGITTYVGGPLESELKALPESAKVGALLTITVPPGPSDKPLRLLILASNHSSQPADVRIGLPHHVFRYDSQGQRLPTTRVPELHPTQQVRLEVPQRTDSPRQFIHEVPQGWGLLPAHASHLVAFVEREIRLEALAVVPSSPEVDEEPAHGSKGEETGRRERTQNPKQ